MHKEVITYQTNDKTRAHIAEVVGPIGAQLTIAPKEILHFQKTGDLTGIITEKEAAHGHENAHDERANGEERDRSVHDIAISFLAIGSRYRFSRYLAGGVRILRFFLEYFLEHDAGCDKSTCLVFSDLLIF